MVTPTIFRYDPDVGYTFIPNLRTRVPHESGGYLLRTNELGFRDDRTPSADAGSLKRIFIFGDSFTAGDGVSNKQRYSAELERLVPGIECYNFGLTGSGMDQQFIAYRKFAQNLPCDLVIIMIMVENIRRITSAFRMVESDDGERRFQPKPYFELHDGVLRRFNDPVPGKILDRQQLAQQPPGARIDSGGRFLFLRRLVKSLGAKEFMQRLSRYQPIPEYNRRASSAWRLMRAILLEWRACCSCPVLVVPLPLYQNIEETADATPYRKRYAELARESDIGVYDVLDDLLAYTMEQRRAFRFTKDVHLTPSGHAALAKAIAPEVASRVHEDREARQDDGT